jgi:hypothetical protein
MKLDMRPDSSSSDAFRIQLARAAQRGRLERLAQASSTIAWSLAIALLVLLLLGLATPVAAWALLVALALFGLALLAAFVVHRAGIGRHRLLTRMDLHGNLPDAVLSTGDWEGAAPDAWREGQRRSTLSALAGIDWRRAWPVAWPRLLWVPLASALFLALVLGWMQLHWQARHHAAELAAARENAPVAPERLQPLQEVFKDWDAAEKIAPSPELEKLLQEIKPMRDQMAAGRMNEKQLLLKLNDVQARLQAMQQKIEAESLEPLAQNLADALRNLDGMSALAAALQRKDFAAAQEQAGQAQEKYAAGQAQMPNADSAQSASQQLGAAAQQASSGHPQAADSLHQMQGALGQRDGQEMSKGLSGLKTSFGQEAARQSQRHNTGIQLAQLGECKNGLCQNPNGKPGIKVGLPQLSLSHSLQPGHGAGSSTDPNRAGAPTNLDSHTNEMRLTGTAGEGASETQTESSNDPRLEQTASGVNAPQFSAYQKMSEQAIDDENLPVADRQMIKRYFEDIRPQTPP